MKVINELKHHRFQNVSIPKPSDLFKEVGERAADPGKFSGSEYLDNTKTKVEMAQEVASEVREQPVEEES